MNSTLKETLKYHLQNIAEITARDFGQLDDVGILGGQGGIALFQFYCGRLLEHSSYAKNGAEIIYSCINKINLGQSTTSYSDGLSGFGWTLQHLVDENLIEIDSEQILIQFDEILEEQMNLDLSDGNYDMLYGSMGYGLYFLKRFHSVKDKKTKAHHSKCLENLVRGLSLMAIKDNHMFKWESMLNAETNIKVFNLSLSHGISSIIYMLSRLVNIGILPHLTSNLLNGSIDYLLANQLKDNQKKSMFPYWVEKSKSPMSQRRVAWCYGDLGIGLALINAGHYTNNDKVLLNGLSILRHTANREVNNCEVIEAGFCHGSFGNAKIFNKLATEFKKNEFHSAANQWLTDGLNRYTKSNVEPFKKYNDVNKSWHLELNLLEGITGIGLCIIDILSSKTNTWDECLLLR